MTVTVILDTVDEISSYSENHSEFWETRKGKHALINEEFLQNSKNWPKRVDILEMKPG